MAQCRTLLARGSVSSALIAYIFAVMVPLGNADNEALASAHDEPRLPLDVHGTPVGMSVHRRAARSQGAAQLQQCLGASFEQVDEEDIAQVTEPAPGRVRLRAVHATVWRRLASPEIRAAED